MFDDYAEVPEKDRLHGDKKIPFFKLIRRALRYSKGVRWMFVVAFILLLLTVLANLILPRLTGMFVDYLSADNIGTVILSSIIGFALCYFGIALLSQGIAFLEGCILQYAGQKIVYGLRMEVFEHIESMSQNQFNEMPTGSLVTRVANYTSSLSELFTDVLIKLITNFLTMVSVFVIMVVISWKLSLIILGFALLIGIMSYFFAKKVGDLFRDERALISDINTFLSENLSGMKITQIFNQQKRKEREFDKKNSLYRKAQYKIAFAFTIYRPLLEFLRYGAVACVFSCGILFSLTAGEITAFYVYLFNFFGPIQQAADQLNQIQTALTACERLFNLLDVPPQVLDKKDAIDIDHFEGKIEFKNVWFAYEGEDWVLKDVSFVVEPKQTVAFVGATGSGKTTILSLIVRNYEIQKGQILIDDIDISHIKIESLRKKVGQMLQDVFLFSGTIKDNITLHDEAFSDEEVKDACDYVNATSFIKKLRHKTMEEVSERGENFSVGQRQLLSFARTILHKPEILILDEATANIDTETEKLIQESLEKMKSIGTMLIVAHRLSTIQHSDNIIVIQNGEIIEQGNHQKLLKNKGYYYKLYQLQFEE